MYQFLQKRQCLHFSLPFSLTLSLALFPSLWMVLPFQSENRVQKKAVAMVIHPLALPGTFLATRCAGGFSSPVTFCNFHSNYITPRLRCMPPHGVKQQSGGWLRIPAAALSAALTPHYAILSYNISHSKTEQRRGQAVLGGDFVCMLAAPVCEWESETGERNGRCSAVHDRDGGSTVSYKTRVCFHWVDKSNEKQAEIRRELCWSSLDLAVRTSRGSQLSLITRPINCAHSITPF